MEVGNKHMGNTRTAVSHERRDSLKAGVAMAATPFIAKRWVQYPVACDDGIGSSVVDTPLLAAG